MIQDNRPRDWIYKAAFRRKDLPSLYEMARQIRETHNTDMIEDINYKFENKADSLSNGIPIQAVTKAEDLVTNPGLQQCINIILGTSSARFTHMGIGLSTTTPTVADTTLGSAHNYPRMIMSTVGWIEPKGMKIFYGAIVGESNLLSEGVLDSVEEVGVFNQLNAGIMLNREVFTTGLEPTRSQQDSVPQGLETWISWNTPFILSCVIEFCPVA